MRVTARYRNHNIGAVDGGWRVGRRLLDRGKAAGPTLDIDATAFSDREKLRLIDVVQ